MFTLERQCLSECFNTRLHHALGQTFLIVCLSKHFWSLPNVNIRNKNKFPLVKLKIQLDFNILPY